MIVIIPLEQECRIRENVWIIETGVWNQRGLEYY